MNRFFAVILFVFICLSSAIAQPTPGASLGVYLADVNDARARELRLQETRGALVGKVLENSPAAKAGLRENDVILSFDEQTIQTASNVYMLLNETLPESPVLLKIVRDGVERDVTVVVGERQGEATDAKPNPELFHRTRTWRLGVKATTLTTQLAAFMGVTGTGLLITEVEPRTLADRAGLKAGDCLLAINGEQVGTTSDLNRTFNELFTKAKGQAKLKIVREKKEQEITIKPDESEN
ncbi:MAG TPA: PDZ domain-containing protein [Blastocatellia bacterium]|nr:PDZ domain-containing protein [Blastocatellia bacterium]